MPKSKKTRPLKTSLKKGQNLKKKEKINDKSQTNEIKTNETISLTTENAETNVEDFLIVAGSYERILYGINAHWIKPGEKSFDNVNI